MMEMPIGFRVSGAFGTKAPIECCPSRAAVTISTHQRADNSEGCYVVTPRTARVYG